MADSQVVTNVGAEVVRRRDGPLRYVVGGACGAALMLALYGAANKGAMAGMLAPAAIMVSYLLWVLYSTSAHRHVLPAGPVSFLFEHLLGRLVNSVCFVVEYMLKPTPFTLR
jgi:hypothetical protein